MPTETSTSRGGMPHQPDWRPTWSQAMNPVPTPWRPTTEARGEQMNAHAGVIEAIAAAASPTGGMELLALNTIRAAMAKPGRGNRALERHRAARVWTGRYCSYLPDPRAPITWAR